MRPYQRRNSTPDLGLVPDRPVGDNASVISSVGSEDISAPSGSITGSTPMSRQDTVKPATRSSTPAADGSEDSRPSHQHGYHYAHHSANASRASSTKTSSSSLQALNEDCVTDARSDKGSIKRNTLVQRVTQQLWQPSEPLVPSTQSVNTSADFPVYPDQSYAVLQSQVHPTPHPYLRSRSSYPIQNDTSSHYPQGRGARTAGNTPISSPGLFSSRSSRSTPPYASSDDEGHISSPYLHPTHLQPPKE